MSETVKMTEDLKPGDIVLVYGYDEHGMGTDFRFELTGVKVFKHTVALTYDGTRRSVKAGTKMRVEA